MGGSVTARHGPGERSVRNKGPGKRRPAIPHRTPPAGICAQPCGARALKSGHWRPAHGPLGFPLFLRPPGASLFPRKTPAAPRLRHGRSCNQTAEAVLPLGSAAMDGRGQTAREPNIPSSPGQPRRQRSRTDRKNKGAPTDAGRPLNSGHRRARIRRASVGVCLSAACSVPATRRPLARMCARNDRARRPAPCGST